MSNRGPNPTFATTETSTIRCTQCARRPAAHATFRQHTGLVLFWRTEQREADWCHRCGMAEFRRAQDRTLWAGWWGLIAFFANFYAIGSNLWNRRAIVRLSDAGAGDFTTEPGPSIWRRRGVYVSIAVIAGLAALIVMADPPSPAEEFDGECVIVTDEFVEASRCSEPDAQRVLAVIDFRSDETCPELTAELIVLEDDQDRGLCLATSVASLLDDVVEQRPQS